MYTDILEHIFYRPMRDYLRHTSITPKQFLDGITECDDTVFSLLDVLATHGAYHILVPLNDLISMMPTCPLDWWKTGMKELSNSDHIEEITTRFQCVMSLELNALAREVGFFSQAEIYEIIWECYPQELKYNSEPNQICNLCVPIPGLFAKKLTTDYFKKLEQIMFPQLKQAVDTLTTCVTVTEAEVAIVKYTLAFYGSEFGAMYHCPINAMSEAVLQIEWSKLSNLRYQEYQQKLQEKMESAAHNDFYLTPTWVEQLDMLCQYSDTLQISNSSTAILKQCLPILMQCVDRNQDASDRLLALLRINDIRDRSDPIMLLGIYRALCVETEAYRELFYAQLSDIFSNTIGMNTAAEVISDITMFYTRYAKELSLRFTLNGIMELHASANTQDIRFYDYYLVRARLSLTNTAADVKWVSQHLFTEDHVVSTFRALLNQLKNRNTPYHMRSLALSAATKLFRLLTGHLDSPDPRVYLDNLLHYLELSDLHAASQVSHQREVFGLYSPSQIQELRNLKKRLDEVLSQLPYVDSFIMYEKNKPQDKNRVMLEHLYTQMLDMIRQQNKTDSTIAKIKAAQNAQQLEIEFLLRVLTGNNPTRNRIVTVLSENQEWALIFSDEIHKVLEQRDTISDEHSAILQRMNIMIETAICDETNLAKEKRKEYFAEALDALCSILPGLDKIPAFRQLISAVKKLVDSFEFVTEF